MPAIFAAVLVPSATAMSEARVVERAAATPTAKATSSRSLRASSRIGCTRTIGATGTRRLSAAQRLQVRRLGAYRIAATPRTARRAAVPAQWICVRTAAQAKALAGLTRSLGHREAKADLDVQAVALPRTLDRKLTIALPDRASAGWTMLDAPAVPAQSFDKGVVYSAGEYDVVQRVSFGSLKESIAVHRRQGIRSWSWKLAWKGGAAPSIGRDGTVRYGEGVVIAAPFIQDARGRRVRDLAWKLDGTTLSVTFNDASLPLPYVLDPASSYPQFLYPSSVGSDYVPGSTTINGMYSPPRNPADTGDQVVDIDDPAGSEYMFWSNSTNNVIEAAPVTNATHPNPMDGAPPIGNGSGYGGYGWSQEALGGVTLPTGPYTVQARVAVSSATADNVTLALKARVWKVRATPSDANFVEISQAPGPVPITSWTQGPSQVYNLNGQTRDLLVPNMTVNPGSNVLGVSDHVFLELALVVVDQGANNTTASLHTSSVNTFLNFGAAAGNTAGTAAGQVVGAPSTMTAGGWTNDNTPRLRANLDDPDWWHHLNFQVCNVATCATQLQTGNSTFGQIAGSTTNFWDTAALPDGGPYYFRARTVEDDAVQNGDDQVGAFNNYTATTCAGPDVGPCGQFRVDTVAPGGAITSPATGSTNRGTVTVSGTSTDATSGVVTHSLQWRRISPAAAGPLATGIACAGASTPTWSCTWDTTTVIDGDYELRLTVTDAATNAATIVSSTYKVDNTAPVFPGGAFSNDGPAADVTYVSSLTTLVSNWSAATDANGINRYEYCLSTLTGCAGTITKNWTSNAMALNQTSGSLTLTEGTTYYSCVRALDAAGNASTPLCSNGQTVDTLPPAVPTTVNDGPAADITWLPSTTTAQANWSGGGDTGSGLNRWEYCISTATNCGGTVAKTWTSTGLTTNMTSGSLALTEGQQYFVCVRAFDNIGNQSAGSACSDGQRVDTVATPSPATVNDGTAADIGFQNNATTINANWSAVTDPTPGVGIASGLQKYQYCITTTAGGGNCGAGALVTWVDGAPLTGTTLSRTGLALVDGSTYYVCVRTYDIAGNGGILLTCSNGVKVDGIPPSAPAASRDGVGPATDIQWTGSATTLSSNWGAATDVNGIGQYEYCLSTATSCGGTVIKNWTGNALALTQTSGSLTLADGQVYFSCVRATDTAGNLGPALCSNGQTVDVSAPTNPTTVNDGPFVDITWNPSLSALQANWTGGADAISGIQRWEYCISTGANCAGTIVKNWATNGTATTSSDIALTLVEGEQYVVCVRAFDNVGNGSVGSSCSNGQRVDTLATPLPGTVDDGPAADVDVQSNLTTINATWPAVTDTAPGIGFASGLQKYQYCISTSSTGATCAGAALVPWTDGAPLTGTALTRSGLTLADGATYFVCIRTQDVAGNMTGGSRCSDGVKVDGVAPTWPGGSASNDGAGPGDVAWTTSLTSLSSNWTAAADGNGIGTYEYCLSTATGCAGTVVQGWTGNGLALTQTSGALALVDGQVYYSCVRATDTAGNVGAPLCSNGQTVDATAPVNPTGVNDGLAADITWVQSLTALSANWTGGGDTGGSGIARWEYCISTGASCGGTIVKNWATNALATTETSSALTLVEGQLYVTCVRAFDIAGNPSVGSTCSNGQRVDTIAPPLSAGVNDGVAADIAFQSSGTTISANWSPVADPAPGVGVASGLQRYQYCVSVSASGATCSSTALVTWTDAAPLTGTSVTRSGLTLANGATYYVCIRSFDVALNTTGTSACSNGNTIDLGPPTASWTNWTENSQYLFSPASTSTLWYNPAAPLEASIVATATVTATDPGAGMNRVDFPSLGAGGAWGPGGSDSSVGPANTWTWGYTFTGGGAIGDPATNNATAYDNGGASTGSPALDFNIQPDSAPPSGGSMPLLSGLQSSTELAQTIPLGTDTDSGVGSYAIDVQYAPLVDGVCQAWDPWVTNSSVGTAVNGTTLTLNHHINEDLPYDHLEDYNDSFCWRDQVRVTDNVGNSYTIAANGLKQFDFSNPDVAITSPAAGSSQGGTFSIGGTTDDVWAGGGVEYANTGSGIDQVTVTYLLPDGPDADALPDASGSACPPVTSFGGPWTALTWTCSWNTSSLPDGTYTLSARARDRSGRLSTIATRNFLIDNAAPVHAWHSFTDNGSPSMHTLGNVAWVNPNAPIGTYQLDARVTAYDLGSGVNRVEFPPLGTGWSPAGTTNGVFTSPLPALNGYTKAYTFTNPASLAAPGVQQARAFDGSGNNSPAPFEIRLDGTAPTGMGASVVNGVQNTPIVTVSLAAGSEGALESGLGSWSLEYDVAPLANDVCGTFTNAWASAASGVGIAPATYSHDVTALGSQCYRYHLLVTDNVGNVNTSTPATARRVDLVKPTVAITTPAAGSIQGSSVAITGTATDAHSGVDHVRLTWTGPSSSSGLICDPATLTGSSPTWGYNCTWATGLLPDGAYTIIATSYDRATNASTTTSVGITLDNFPPFVGFHSFAETTPYTYWAGPIGSNPLLWFNPAAPAGSYSFDVLINANDPSGVSRVEFDGAGTGWTPGAAVGTQTVGVGPATRYAQTYTFNTATPGLVDPPTLTARAFDVANNPGTTTFDIQADSAIPVAGAVTYTNGFVSSTSVTVNLDTGNDGAGSGIASWQLLRSNGTLAGTTCNAWSAYSTVVASGLGTLVGSRPDTVTDPGCFRYRLRVTDNVGNVHDIDGTSELKVDLVPPVGTLAITPATNPTYQHLAAPNQLFVNTSPGHGGTFSVDVSGATAASGILDVNFPLLAAGFTGDGVSPGPGPNISRTYTWTPGATAPAAGKFARVRSNSLGQLDLPFSVIADAAAPVGATATHASGFTTGSTVSVTFTIGNDGSGSGIRDSQLERQTGTLAAGACTWSGSWTPAGALNATGPYADSGLVHATCYRYRVRVTDRVDNVGYSATSTPIMVDQTAPTGASIVLAEGVNPNRQYLANPTTMWVNPTPGGAANFTATVTATDPESGTGAATWPSLGSTFVTTPAGFNATYAWSAGAVAPSAATSVVQVANGAGMTTPVPFTVLVDGTNPTGSTLDQQNGYDTDFSVDLAFTNGGDGAGSGIATWRIERRSATYNLGLDTCTGWGSWGTYPLPTGQPTSPYVDTGVTQPNCYQYRIVEVDNVGNQSAVADGDTAKVINDITPPTAFNLTFPANPALPAITTAAAAPSCSTVPTYSTATPAFTWTASTDGESGLSGYDTYVDGIGTVDGTVLAPATTWTPPALADGAHTLGVRARDNQGNFTNAGPAFPTNVRVDLTAPTATLGAPANAAWTIDTTPTLSWSAADGNCVARVEVYVDDLVTPIAVASGSENSWTPTGALASGMHSWRVEAIDTLGNRTSSTTRTFGTDVTPPTAFAVLTPTAGQTVRGFVNASWTAATDADSGLAAANAYEIWVDGSLKLSVGPGVTSATVPGVTNGIHSLYVRAIDGVGNTMSTMAVSFTGYGAIPAPVLVSPTNNTRTNVVPALDWNWPSDGGPAPTDYDVYLDGVLVGSETHPTSIHTIADPGDGVHTWRIEQHDPYTGTATSGTWSFNLDRTLPVNPGPLTRVATTVTWPAPTDPAAPTASGINYQEFWINDGVNPPTSSLMSAGSTSRNYGTLPDGNYTMWVRAYDRAGNFADTPTLLVVNDSLPPTAFNLNAPAALPALPAITNGGVPPTCESDATFTTATPTLTWQASSDATSGLAGYDVLVDGTLVTSVGPAVTSHTLAAPLSGGLHTWQVVARDNFGLTRASTPAPMSVRVDTASPTMAFGAPVDNGYTSDTTPTLTFSAGDESCAARIEVTVDGTVRAVLTGGATGWTVPTPLSEGAHSWALRAYDSVGNITSAGAPRTLNIDTTGPTAVTAIFPTNAGSAPEQMMTFSWSAGSDAGSGVDHYDLIVDGAPSGTGLTATTRGTFPIYAGAHTWSIRAYDAVGNSTLFSFSFTATPVPDVTAPDPFNLLSPADNAAFVAGNSLTWQPAYDFKGVTQYRVYIDGALSGTTAGNVTSYTPNVGSGSPLCTVDFDPTPDASCVTGLRYSRGSQGTTTTNAATTTPDWNLASYAGWSTGGALGVGDPTATPDYAVGSGYDGDRVWTSAEYDMSVPAGGADVRLEHRYDFSMIGQNAYDGGSIEIKVDTANDGFANDTWAPTCVYGTKGTYGTSIRCTHEIVEANGGFNVVMWGGSATAQPLWHQNAFSGSSGGTVQTKLRMAAFAGKNVKLRFRIGMDGCYAGMPTTRATQCSQQGITNPKTAKWRIDNISLADPALLPGPHTWYVQARDAAGNSRTSNQTWTFNLS